MGRQGPKNGEFGAQGGREQREHPLDEVNDFEDDSYLHQAVVHAEAQASDLLRLGILFEAPTKVNKGRAEMKQFYPDLGIFVLFLAKFWVSFWVFVLQEGFD